MQEAVAPTGGINMEDYPIGGTVDIRVLEGAAALVPGSVRDDYVRGQDQLLDRDFDPKKIVSSVGMECPGCGAQMGSSRDDANWVDEAEILDILFGEDK